MRECKTCGTLRETVPKRAVCRQCFKQERRKYYAKNREKGQAVSLVYRKKNLEQVRERDRQRQPVRTALVRAKYRDDPRYRKHVRDSAKERYWNRRKQVLAAYGNACACCGETQYEFLAIDHVAPGHGPTERKQGYMGDKLMAKIIREGFPSSYQILCHNCNNAKGFYGACPHKPAKIAS